MKRVEHSAPLMSTLAASLFSIYIYSFNKTHSSSVKFGVSKIKINSILLMYVQFTFYVCVLQQLRIEICLLHVNAMANQN